MNLYRNESSWCHLRFFMLVQSASIIAGTILTILATRYDEQFDRVFGILTTMHFRIVIVGLLTSALAICLAR